MKSLSFCLILIIGFCNTLFAQTNRSCPGIVRINGTMNFYNSVKMADDYSQNGTLGCSVDFGAKQFLGQSNLFLEETIGFVYSELPFLERMLFDPYPGFKEPYVFWDKGHETGASASFFAGYQFPLKNNLSIDVFAGPDFRYLFNYKSGVDSEKKYLHKTNLRLKAGANLNIKNLSISLFASPDLLDRGKDYKRYRTILVGIGMGYYFKW